MGQHLQVVGRATKVPSVARSNRLEAGLEFPGEGVPIGSSRSKVALVGPMCARLKATRAAGEDALSLVTCDEGDDLGANVSTVAGQ